MSVLWVNIHWCCNPTFAPRAATDAAYHRRELLKATAGKASSPLEIASMFCLLRQKSKHRSQIGTLYPSTVAHRLIVSRALRCQGLPHESLRALLDCRGVLRAEARQHCSKPGTWVSRPRCTEKKCLESKAIATIFGLLPFG